MAKPDGPSILLLGGSRHQVPAIETAKRLGYRTVLCDYLPDNPGQFSADVFYQLSTTDRRAMLRVAQDEGVSGVLAFGTDVAAATAAYVGESLDLPTNPLAAVEVLSEKHLFRAYLADHGFPCPRHARLAASASVDELLRAAEGMRLPVVLKPTDSSGSKGVHVLRSLSPSLVADALADAAGFSRNGLLLLEEYIEAGFPRVVGGDVFVVDGTVRFWGLMSCLRDRGIGGLVPVGERWPSGLAPAQLDAAKAQIKALVTSLGVRFGEMNVEIIFDRHDVPHFLELAARAGGNMLPNQLSDIAGVDLVEANVRFAMGETMELSFDGVSAPGAYATYMLHAQRPGIYRGVELSSELLAHLYRRVDYVAEGSHVGALGDASKALGVLFLRFSSTAEMEGLLDRIGELVLVHID
ncbi:ATP-grasp domain-containing protein [Olsenella massiliensis]|uniref:ATP-grasp domain-containing protein n=1 Tax=Olsenella massiliensis TaxID=1622075 RepID=UPI00071C693C|nr:hypothetical protein [Olsenella massiliensis]